MPVCKAVSVVADVAERLYSYGLYLLWIAD